MTAGTATVLAKQLVPVSGAETELATSFTSARTPAVAAKTVSTRPVPPVPTTTTAAPATTTSPATTTDPPPATTTTTPPPPPAPPPTPAPPGPAAPVDQVVALVNQARLDAGCAALRVAPQLTAAASAHSADMAGRDYFSHTTPEGVAFDQRIRNAGYESPGGENIAMGQKSAEDVMDAWMKSKGHKANILNCQFTAIGVGLATNGWYWTQDFGY